MWEMTNISATIGLIDVKDVCEFYFPCGKQQCDPGMVLISSFCFLFSLSYDSENSRDDSDSRQDDQMVS